MEKIEEGRQRLMMAVWFLWRDLELTQLLVF